MFFQFFDVASVASIPRRNLDLNGNRTGKRVEFFGVPALIWRSEGAGLLNLGNKESSEEYSFKFFIFRILAKFRKSKNAGPTCITTIITLEPCALNAGFHHFILRFNKFSYFADTIERRYRR